jgi:hypothetical protein
VQVFEPRCCLNDFSAMAKGGRKGVPWCISYQADQGSFTLQAGVPIWRSRAHLPHFRYVSLQGAEPLLCYLCTAWVNSSVDTVVMLVSIVIITSTLCCGHDEWCVMIISVWCVFSKLLRPSWISKYIVKTGCNSVTIRCTGHWLFCHHRHTTCRWWSIQPSLPLFIWCSRGQ